jgi:hypothetical protein
MAAPTPYPLSVGRIFELGWSLFRFAWRQMLAAAAVCLVPAYLVSIPIAAAFSPLVDGWLAEVNRAAVLRLPQPPVPEGFDVAVISLLASGILLFLASLLAVASIVRIVSAVFRGERLAGVQAVRDAFGRLLSLLAGQLLYFVGVLVIVMIGLLLSGALVLGGGLLAFLGLIVLVGSVAAILFLAVRVSLLSQAVMVEQVGGADGLSRSWRIVAGSGWRVLGYIVLIGLIGLLAGLILASLPAAALRLGGTSLSDVAARTAIEAIVAIVLTPLAPIVLTLLYFDLRWRHGETVPVPGGGEVAGPVLREGR